MADLRELIRTVHATPGVRVAVAAGRDGLLIDAAGVDGETSTPEALAAFIAAERAKWGRVVREARIAVE